MSYQKIIDEAKQTIAVFEQKIKDKIAEVWQAEEEISMAIPEEIQASEDVVEEKTEKLEIRQAELFSLF